MTSFWTFFIQKNHFTALLAGVLILAGIVAVTSIPKESSPEVQIPVGIITTVLPGASAEDVERLITDKLEDKVLGVERVSKVTSTSGSGVSSITVEFDANADIDKSIQLLKDEVDKAVPELPAEAEDPRVTDVNFADQPILIISIAGDLAPAELTQLGEEVQETIERVPGVSSVALSGVREREVQVIVEQAKLRQYGLSVSDVTNAIRASGVASPAGSITISNIQYDIRLEAGLTKTEEVGDIALKGPGGAVLRVRDVARVVDGLSDATTFSRVSVDGSPSAPALTLSVFKSRGGNILATGSDVKKTLEELSEGPLSGTETVISYDAADDIAHDLTELTRVGLETVVLVMIMLFLTLGWRESLVAAASIPLSFLIAFIGLAASGNTINFISLFSLILAIGILVDSGIVVVEAIHTRLAKTGDKKAAAIAAIKEYAWPLVAGTFTTVAVFIPLFFLSGIVGKFIASIPFTVIFVLLASIFVALGLVPLLAVYALRPSTGKLAERQEKYNELAQAWYERFLRGILGNRKRENQFIWLMGGLFILALALPAVGAVKVAFFPGEDSGFVYVEIEKPQGTDLSDTDLSVREVEELLYTDSRIESFVSEVGAGSAFGGSGISGSKAANITVNFKDSNKQTSSEIVEELRRDLTSVTSAKITVSEPAGGPPTSAPVQVTFVGEDLASLEEALRMGERVLSEIPDVTNISTSMKDDGAEFVVRLDTAKAVQLGVSPLTVADTLRTALYGAKATDIRTGTDDIEVRMKVDLNQSYKDPSETTHTTIESVQALSIPGSQGPVPLATIATISYEPANAVIRHEDGSRTGTLTSDVTKNGNALAAVSEFQKRIKNAELPEGVTMKIGGESEDVNQSFAEMGLALLAGAALMLAILVLEFNSFRHSLYLLAIIPLSLIGVLAGLMITGSPLSFPSMLGVIALAGVIINHGIILMDSMARIGKSSTDASLTDVVVEASVSRFRPILLTTITTVVGMIPLSFASALWGPLAFSIMFGLAFSMVLTLILIPVLYHRWPGKEIREQFKNEI
ncbi:efflux RND transporter permease subunit [Patescibacteria group bacterium]|nr:efflux RND transporter permease subunit [Patescibacteria group bacterium]MBU2080775.1 efflux RND transporter permease subunit [Patescibacteria group bacterium]MBU2123880.1 efflux RND transporter permease subunit [Patescibacteria group bacterium]MBU2194829.1 efflux RND transporter permease subunit [Patescibacteria group bacterium]